MEKILSTASTTWAHIEGALKPVLIDLDPSLFQNITLAILAIFIPFAIVFLTDLLDKKKQRNEFEKMVLTEEVLGTSKIFWLSIFGVVFFAFFTGTDISVTRKLIALIAAVILIILFWKPFSRTLRFSEGYKPEFQIGFLKKLRLPKLPSMGNKRRMDRMVRAWTSFWSEKSEYLERDFTKEFIDHIDSAIANGKYGLAVTLGQAYEKNLDKRDRFSIGYEVLPKVFEWHKQFWELEQSWLRRETFKDKVQESISSKYFPTFKKWLFKLWNQSQSKPDFFWNWHYFQQALFPAIAKALLLDSHSSFQLFTTFKKHIETVDIELEGIEDEDKKQRKWNYIMGLFGSFCPMFFETIDKLSDKFDVWEHYFPKEWKITISNSKNKISRVILHEFIEWSQKRIFGSNESGHDKDLTEVVQGIFPNAHHSLFPAFISLLFASEVKYAVQNEPRFYLINTGLHWSGEKSEKEIQQMFEQQDLSQKEETVSIIFEYFRDWRFLKIYKDDISEEELKDWETYPEEKRKQITIRVRKVKFTRILEELNSEEIKELCKDSELREHRRKNLVELVELILKRLN